MEICITGGKAFIGVPIGEVHTSGGNGRANGHNCHVNDDKSGGVGGSLEISRTCFEVNCECAGAMLQPGDWIEFHAKFVLFIDVGEIEYSLCGGTCRGSTGTGLRGIGVGLSIEKIRWVIDN
jgi:hypothetical protein